MKEIQINPREMTTTIYDTKYVCEICDTQYDSEYQARSCERECKQKACNHERTEVKYFTWSDNHPDADIYMNEHFNITIECKDCGKEIGETEISENERDEDEDIVETEEHRQLAEIFRAIHKYGVEEVSEMIYHCESQLGEPKNGR